MALVSDDMLLQALSPEPRDFENLWVKKTSEEVVDGKYQIGFEVYVVTAGRYLYDENFTEILIDRGICVFSPEEKHHDDYISQEETILSVDDPALPQHVREAWIDYWSEKIDPMDAAEFLESDQSDSSAIVREMCRQLASK